MPERIEFGRAVVSIVARKAMYVCVPTLTACGSLDSLRRAGDQGRSHKLRIFRVQVVAGLAGMIP